MKTEDIAGPVRPGRTWRWPHVSARIVLLAAVLIGVLLTPKEDGLVVPTEPNPVRLPASVSPSRVSLRTFWSEALKREMTYYIFLPPGYESTPEARYPVLYMLHGYSGTNDEWKWYGIFEKADRLLRSNETLPFIIVLPLGDYSYWMDHANGGPQWGVYTAHDVITEIDSRFRTAADREHRAVGGLSMGAHGALQLAINFPGVYKVVGAHSPSLRDFEIRHDFFGDREHFDAHDPIMLYHLYPELARTLTLWIDVGTEDDWRPVIMSFHQQLEADGIPHELHEYPGTHDREYWEANTVDYLRFYGAALGGPVYP
jgi:enterochelin esterase-like enzyme